MTDTEESGGRRGPFTDEGDRQIDFNGRKKVPPLSWKLFPPPLLHDGRTERVKERCHGGYSICVLFLNRLTNERDISCVFLRTTDSEKEKKRKGLDSQVRHR